MQGPPTLVCNSAHGMLPGFSAFFNRTTMFLVLYLISVCSRYQAEGVWS